MTSWLDSDVSGGEVVNVAGVAYVFFEGWMRTGGSLSWSSSNPGNIVTSAEAESYGAYVGVHNYRFAVFTDDDTGMASITRYLRLPKRAAWSIFHTMDVYAPEKDGNNPGDYANEIADSLGRGTDTTLSALSDEELATVADTIKRIEGWDARAETRLECGPDDLPDEVASWLENHPEAGERADADQPFTDTKTPKSRGVANLQRLLNQAGANPQLDPDGAFGPKSADAARAFQASRGLGADGVVGSGTWRALLDELGM